MEDRALVQRCQWHKRENVVAYLPKPQQETMRRKLQSAYEQPTYEAAKGALLKLKGELKLINLIESINAGLGQRTDKVDRWRNSDQKQRWVASALLDIERGLNRITGHRHLSRLKAILKTMTGEKESQKTRKAA